MKPVAQILRSTMLRPALAVALAAFGFALTSTLQAMPIVSTFSGGPYNGNPNSYYGYTDGDTFFVAQFHSPYGMALDSTGNNLFVADRDNNAVRQLDIPGNLTSTFVPNTYVPTNLISQPVGVAVNGGNVFVLNRGRGTNGTVLQFDSTYGELIATNASALTNAAGITVDAIGNIYLTVQSNRLIQITPAGVQSVIVTITNAGTSLQGIAMKHDGKIAVCDSGRNGIYVIDPNTGNVTNYAGFHGAGDFGITNRNSDSSANAKFNQPYGVAVAGDDTLIVTDNGNHRVKLVLPSGVVTNLYGVRSTFWGNGPGYPAYAYPGWSDGTVIVPDNFGDVEARQPVGVAFSPDGSVYVTEDYYHLIRHVTSTGLALPPPPPPPVPAPTIGWVSFVGSPIALSVLNPGTSFVFNNDVLIAIKPGVSGSQVFYTSGATPLLGSIPDPSPSNGTTPPSYTDGLVSVTDLGATRYPDMLIKAIGTKNDGSPNSAVVQTRFQFIAANPSIVGNNGAQFVVNDETLGAQMWYTTNGVDPTNVLSSSNFGPISSGDALSFNITANLTFKVRAFRANYQPSGVSTAIFTTSGFTPNRISFGLTNGEPSSSFIARPGQFFYAPVTLQLQPGGEKMYSLQFNVTVTNGLATANQIKNGAGIDFFPMLMSQVGPTEGRYFPPADGQWYLPILPLVSDAFSNTVPSMFVNTNNNLLGIGWLYRLGFKYSVTDTNGGVFMDFDTTKHDLITYSIAHDTLFNKAGGTVVVGAYSFQIPTNASISDKYFMQLGSPSATRDGVGAPGAAIYIQSPLTNQAVTVGTPSYVVGDVAPFHWFNAGDFGEGKLLNDDVMQVFQSAIHKVNLPPLNSDLFLAMDSSGAFGGFDIVNNYYTSTTTLTTNQLQALFDGNDTSINQVAFGDGVLDVSDVYVTLRRSLDPSLLWFKRFWTNNQFVAVTTANLAFNSNAPSMLLPKLPLASPPIAKSLVTTYQQSSITFSAGDAVVSAGQTIQIPINAKVFGNYPMRVLGLNINVYPLDGSPDITIPVQFIPGVLGAPTPGFTASKSAGNYSAAWLNSSIAGFTGAATIGTLQITLPTNAPANAAYSIHFDHASASPNGLASFPKKTFNGLITLSNRSASSWNDGIPDSWRLRWFGTIYNQLSAKTADADGDGANNWHEYNAGTDPNDSSSVLRVNAQGLTVHWPSVLNRTYVVEKSASLFGGTWTSIVTNTGTGTDMQYQDNSGGARFYRVRVSP